MIFAILIFSLVVFLISVFIFLFFAFLVPALRNKYYGTIDILSTESTTVREDNYERDLHPEYRLLDGCEHWISAVQIDCIRNKDVEKKTIPINEKKHFKFWYKCYKMLNIPIKLKNDDR